MYKQKLNVLELVERLNDITKNFTDEELKEMEVTIDLLDEESNMVSGELTRVAGLFDLCESEISLVLTGRTTYIEKEIR